MNDTNDWFTSFFQKCLKNVGQDSVPGIVQEKNFSDKKMNYCYYYY
jgi:hypothetical protein